MAIDDLITLMERFVSGEAITLRDANRLEGLLLESSSDAPELEELADELASYQPGGGEGLYNYEEMKPRVAHYLGALRARLPAGRV